MRVYGIFTIQTKKFRNLDVMVAQNCACLRNPENRMFQFDLKGSSVNRRTPFNVLEYLSCCEAWTSAESSLDLRITNMAGPPRFNSSFYMTNDASISNNLERYLSNKFTYK